ncbi:10128_t:CDS:2, partial [Entrophospora sp. SA101]
MVHEHPTGLLDIPYVFAIEVQGQDEKYIELFHRDPKNFIKQQERDQLKKELCEELDCFKICL